MDERGSRQLREWRVNASGSRRWWRAIWALDSLGDRCYDGLLTQWQCLIHESPRIEAPHNRPCWRILPPKLKRWDLQPQRWISARESRRWLVNRFAPSRGVDMLTWNDAEDISACFRYAGTTLRDDFKPLLGVWMAACLATLLLAFTHSFVTLLHIFQMVMIVR